MAGPYSVPWHPILNVQPLDMSSVTGNMAGLVISESCPIPCMGQHSSRCAIRCKRNLLFSPLKKNSGHLLLVL